jgi:hypothetical protein
MIITSTAGWANLPKCECTHFFCTPVLARNRLHLLLPRDVSLDPTRSPPITTVLTQALERCRPGYLPDIFVPLLNCKLCIKIFNFSILLSKYRPHVGAISCLGANSLLGANFMPRCEQSQIQHWRRRQLYA